MDLQLNGKICLVTGASAGIGAGIAQTMASEGAQLVITARRRERLDLIAKEIETAGGLPPLVLDGDLTDPSVPSRLADSIRATFGGCEILVNNAGGSTPMAPDANDEDWERSFEINFTAARRMTNAVLPEMRRAGWGRIINITGAMEPFGTNAAQAGSATTHAWAKGLSRDLGRGGITVNCIPPGRINSEQVLERLHRFIH